MRALLILRYAMVVLLSSLVLTLQVAGAHLHLCLDGQDPRLQVHAFDAATDLPTVNAGAPHVDKIVALTADRLVRDSCSQCDLPPVPPTTLAWNVVEVPAFSPSAQWQISASPTATRNNLLPPPRGPPLTAQA
jgi:hypothetical protein